MQNRINSATRVVHQSPLSIAPLNWSSSSKQTNTKFLFLLKEEEDICPDCYKTDKKMYAGAEHQKFGEPIPVVSKKAGKREAPETNGVTKKSKAE